MRSAIWLVAVLLLAPTAEAKHRRSGPRPNSRLALRPCDPTWCKQLSQAERTRLGGLLVDALRALRLPGKLKLKPLELEPRGSPWQAGRLKKLPAKKKAALVEGWGAGYQSGAFPYPFVFRGLYRLPGKTDSRLEVVVELLPVPVALLDRHQGLFASGLKQTPDSIEWLLIFAEEKDRKLPDLLTEGFLILGARTEQGTQEVPEADSAPTGLAPLRALRVSLKGPRKIVQQALGQIDRKALMALLPAKS